MQHTLVANTRSHIGRPHLDLKAVHEAEALLNHASGAGENTDRVPCQGDAGVVSIGWIHACAKEPKAERETSKKRQGKEEGKVFWYAEGSKLGKNNEVMKENQKTH
jgi:hypothetical protein